MNKFLRRSIFFSFGLALFCVAFLIGAGSRQMNAHAAPEASSDSDIPDDSVSLPADVRNRLAHAVPGAGPQDFRPAITFWEVLGKVKTRYVDKITDQDHLSRGAVASMLHALRDPYSRVTTPEETKLYQQEAAGQFSGVGVILGARLSGAQVPVESAVSAPAAPAGPPRREPDAPDRVWQLVVVDTVPGSAAARAGLQTGDVVSKINGVRIDRAPLASKTIDDLNLMLNGPSVHSAVLSVVRPSTNATIDVKMENAAPVSERPVEARILPDGAAYARISLFTPTTGADLARSLNQVSSSHPTSLVLDLRDNPGGSLAGAEEVVGDLAPGGPAGILDTKAGAEKLPAAAPADTASAAPLPDYAHMTVLVNGGTASTAELVAAALRERKAAVLLGSPTFGNGLIQTVYPLPGDWTYSLTTGRLRGPDGTDFNQHGLAVERPISPGLLTSVTAAAVASLPPQPGPSHL